MSHNNVVLDFASGSLGVNNYSGMLVYPINALTKRESPDYIHSYYHCSFMGVVQMDSEESSHNEENSNGDNKTTTGSII